MSTETEVYVPISDSRGFHGFGHWDRRRGVCPPLDFWGRHELDMHRPPTQSVIPLHIQRGHGDMHLNDWISPNALIGEIRDDGKHLFLHHWKDVAPLQVNEWQDVFEVKLNVSDYKPEELKVKVLNGLVSIQGRHEEDRPKHDTKGRDTGRQEHVSKRFSRTLTLPKKVEDDMIRCTLTNDGHLLLCAPINMSAAIESNKAPRQENVPFSKCGDRATEKRLDEIKHPELA